MKVIILASGSKGNATYIETSRTKILIDAGLSYRQIKLRLANRGIEFNRLDAILITHEHIDHTRHLASLLEKTGAKLYIAKKSLQGIGQKNQPNPYFTEITYLSPDVRYQIKDLMFVPIALSHDARSTFGYLLKNEISSLAYITDTGHLPEKYDAILRQIQMLVIESNHDVEMLLTSSRTWDLKQRILSNEGHLSNQMCKEILNRIVSDQTKIVVLAHISEECNTYDLAYRESYDVTVPKGIALYVAKQHEETDLFDLEVPAA